MSKMIKKSLAVQMFVNIVKAKKSRNKKLKATLKMFLLHIFAPYEWAFSTTPSLIKKLLPS
jgi:hypothetical protein